MLLFILFFQTGPFPLRKSGPASLCLCTHLLIMKGRKKNTVMVLFFLFFLLEEGRTLANGFGPGLSHGQFHPLHEGVNGIRSRRALPPPAPGLQLTPGWLIPLQENNVDNSS